MEYLSPSPNSRFKVLSHPAVAPGKCIICGAVNRPVVDFGMSVTGYGAIYFCCFCISEAAQPFGMVPATELADNEKATDAIVSDYLARNNYSVVKNDRAAIIGSMLSDLSAAIGLGSDSIFATPTDSISEDASVDERQGKLFDIDNDGVAVQGTNEIDFDSFLEEPIGVSDSPKHESGNFQLQ